MSGPSRVYAGGGGTAEAECTVRGDDLHSNSTTDAGFSAYTDAVRTPRRRMRCGRLGTVPWVQVLCSSSDGQPFGHNRHRPKIGRECCAPLEDELDPM